MLFSFEILSSEAGFINIENHFFNGLAISLPSITGEDTKL